MFVADVSTWTWAEAVAAPAGTARSTELAAMTNAISEIAFGKLVLMPAFRVPSAIYGATRYL